MTPITLAVVGGGGRGYDHAGFALRHPDRARVVAVAEPRDFHRDRIATEHAIPPPAVFTDWEDLVARGRLADAALVCTQDAMHAEPVQALADLGYHIMLEKPMAPTEAECHAIVAAVKKAGVQFAVGHVLRYQRYSRLLKQFVDDGRIGDILSIQHLEPVGYWHYAQGYVRGMWRQEATSSPVLMAKSCHDLDWMRHIVGSPIARVASFGRLSHFRPENRPDGATERCVDCPVEASCVYSAERMYVGLQESGHHQWPLNVVVNEYTPEAVQDALRHGPYGRCVYLGENDVVDHQVVAMEFADGVTGTFTMTVAEPWQYRKTRVFGTRGELDGDGEHISIYDYLTDTKEHTDAGTTGDATAGGGHGGGDERLMDAFVHAVATGDGSRILSGPDESLETHLAVFAAERARHTGTVQPVVVE